MQELSRERRHDHPQSTKADHELKVSRGRDKSDHNHSKAGGKADGHDGHDHDKGAFCSDLVSQKTDGNENCGHGDGCDRCIWDAPDKADKDKKDGPGAPAAAAPAGGESAGPQQGQGKEGEKEGDEISGEIPLVAGQTARESGGGAHVCDEYSIDTDFSTGHSDAFSFKADDVYGSMMIVKNDSAPDGAGITASHKAPNTHPAPAFGEEVYQPKFTDITFKVDGATCKISGKLVVETPWGTNSGGNTDVPDASSLSTKAELESARDDLKPNAIGKPARSKYWSKSLTEQHEKFHGTDDYQWTTSTGWPAQLAAMKAKKVKKGSEAADVQQILKDAIDKLNSENYKYYLGGGAAHADRAGEKRAYADGKAGYTALSKACGDAAAKLP